MGLSCLTEVTGAVRKSDRLYIHSHTYLFPHRTGLHVSNNPVDQKCTGDSNPMKLQYTGVDVTYARVEKYKYIEVKVSFTTITSRSLFHNNIQLQRQSAAPPCILTRLLHLVTTGRQLSQHHLTYLPSHLL